MLRHIPLCLISLFCAGGINAQELRTRIEATSTDSRMMASPSDDQQRQFILYRVHGLVEKTLALQDVRARTVGISRLADLLWQHDETYARQLFEKGLAFTDPPGESPGSRSISYLRRNLIILIAKRDRTWAKHLIENAVADPDSDQSQYERNEINIEVASSLARDDPDAAVEFALRGLQRSVTPSFIWFLKEFRQTNEAAANKLFLQSLRRFERQSSTDINEFALLGTYIFTSHAIKETDPTSMRLTRVGDIGIVDLTADQPGISPALVRAYLETAVKILSRPINDPHQQQLGYVLGYLLLPKAKKHATDLIALLSSAMSSLTSRVPQNLTQESAYVNIKRVAFDSAEDAMRKAEKISGAESRDVAYLDVAFNSWLKQDFKTARAATAKITDDEASDRLNVLINFGEGARLLKDSPEMVTSAEKIANEMPQGVERALLFLGIGQVATKGGNFPQARGAIDLAVKSAQAVPDARRPFLLLTAASQLAGFDSVASESLLADAVKEFNSHDAATLANIDWRQRVEIGPLVEKFPLKVKDVEIEFGQAFRRTIANNLEAGAFRAESLKNEHLRVQAFIELAAANLRALPKTTIQPEERVVRVGEDGMRRSASKTVMPAYPAEDVRKRQQGVAIVEAQYDGKGNVTDAIMLEAPTTNIGQAVVHAVKQWKFTPSTLKGEPISVRGKLTFYFVIDEKQNGRVENPKRFQ